MEKYDIEEQGVAMPPAESVALGEAARAVIYDALDYARSQQPRVDEASAFAKRQEARLAGEMPAARDLAASIL